MKYLKITLLLLGALALTAQGCALKQPEPADIVSDLDEERRDLNEREDDLDQRERELERRENTMEEKEEEMDDENGEGENTMEEDEPKNQNERGREVLNPVTLESDENSIVIMLHASLAEKPDGNIAIGCEDVLVAHKIQLDEKNQSDLAIAMVQLLTQRADAFQAEGLSNSVWNHGLSLANVKFEDGKRVVEFEGQGTSSGVCESPRIKGQIEETIALYTDEFEIRLNGTASNWRCLYNESGECV